MAQVFIAEPVEELLREFRPGDKTSAAWAISFLEDDSIRNGNKIDLLLLEDDLSVWGFVIGHVWLAFVESPKDAITVVHIALLSRFRAQQFGFEQ